MSAAPQGYFKLVTARGRKIICFACNTCGIFTRFISGPARAIQHCGKLERAPLLTLLLPERVIGSSSENFVKVGTWDASPFTFEEV